MTHLKREMWLYVVKSLERSELYFMMLESGFDDVGLAIPVQVNLATIIWFLSITTHNKNYTSNPTRLTRFNPNPFDLAQPTQFDPLEIDLFPIRSCLCCQNELL
ncbi:hypothetical protein HanXRQr2_Chr06g0241641 [Helianthus annuus]|uniref:Uncharacterized protein n=1 Tax=Helianthus annuus TaxID=4232 RepID=A0A251UF53_HELAN|nr:hypothetical protein HanXRQr2_Chr06g0241621 [Helianthus annuus]KAF5800873.1 hypothetical protein HanXRQr2_Chr06g0241641 [Helianthus annuus]KAJ0559251.1 hypothetical protein HanHA300_Chr06g0198281 [Helianthus annuus]KAJ0559253.1 hypothetical protein HanHA300_Chr06g0198301 [Helianthus annuus]KAJ0559255.1 hypothetical protein HanHA300_Chr06g0198321 [Helianthus annuus]